MGSCSAAALSLSLSRACCITRHGLEPGRSSLLMKMSLVQGGAAFNL
jgi:hypothetical protein